MGRLAKRGATSFGRALLWRGAPLLEEDKPDLEGRLPWARVFNLKADLGVAFGQNPRSKGEYC